MPLPEFRQKLQALVSLLHWHGGLDFDVILTASGPKVIDVNPRLVEPGNAFHCGVDLVAAMLQAATNSEAVVQPNGQPGVLTHQMLVSILGTAEQTASRLAILRDVSDAWRRRGAFSGSHEELTPTAGDPIALVPVLVVLGATLLAPTLWRRFQSGAVGSYGVSPSGWKAIIEAFDSA